MHSSQIELGTTARYASFTSAVSVPLTNGNTYYLVAAFKGSPAALQMFVYSDATGYSAYSTLSTTGLPASGINSKVALAAASISGTPQVVMAVIGADQKMYVASLQPGYAPGSTWTSMQWYPAYWVFPAGTQPAIGSRQSHRRLRYQHRLSAVVALHDRHHLGLPGHPTGTSPITYALRRAVDRSKAYVLCAGDERRHQYCAQHGTGGLHLHALRDVDTNPGTWSGTWTSLGGRFLGPPAITPWQGGLAIYGIGTDNNLYHSTHINGDALSVWSPWNDLNKGFFVQPEGISVNTSSSLATRINIIAVNSEAVPTEIDFPW